MIEFIKDTITGLLSVIIGAIFLYIIILFGIYIWRPYWQNILISGFLLLVFNGIGSAIRNKENNP